MTNQPKTEGGMDAFFTRDTANEGVRVPLMLPNGEPSGHWMIIYGCDSDHFRAAEVWSRREATKLMGLSETERDLAQMDLTHRLRAKLVKAWSFDQECTEENVLAFFRKAPQVGDAIDRIAGNRTLFFGLASATFTATPPTSSGSTRSQKDPSSPAESPSPTSSSAEATPPT